MKITPELLTKTLNIPAERSMIWATHINDVCTKYSITTKNAVAMFIAQCAHESALFTRLIENLNYSSEGLAKVWKNRFADGEGKPNALAKSLHRKPEAIANIVYANRMGNGSTESGEGWKYRGRGIIQLTGKENYQNLSTAVKIDFVNHPELLESPEYAVLSAGWYWNSRNINKYADLGDYVTVTKLIQGKDLGLKERTELFEKIKKEL